MFSRHLFDYPGGGGLSGLGVNQRTKAITKTTGSLKLLQVQYVLTFENQVYSSILSRLQHPKMCMRALLIDV